MNRPLEEADILTALQNTPRTHSPHLGNQGVILINSLANQIATTTGITSEKSIQKIASAIIEAETTRTDNPQAIKEDQNYPFFLAQQINQALNSV